MRFTEQGEWVEASKGITSFIGYQNRVREQLTKFASAGSWYVASHVESPEMLAQRVWANFIGT